MPERVLIVTETPTMQRLRDLPPGYRVRGVESWDELLAAMDQASPASAVLADPYMGQPPGAGPSPQLRRVIMLRGTVPVIAVMHLRRNRSADVETVRDWEVSAVLNLNVRRSLEGVHEVLRLARAEPLKRKVEPLMGGFATDNARKLVRAACDVAVEGGASPELAAIFGVDPRTITTWCRKEGLPPPRRVLAWARVLLACMMLSEHGRSVTNVARACGYANDHALRRALRELGAGNPSDTPREALFTRATEAFRINLRDARDKARARRRGLRAGRTPPPLSGE